MASICSPVKGEKGIPGQDLGVTRCLPCPGCKPNWSTIPLPCCRPDWILPSASPPSPTQLQTWLGCPPFLPLLYPSGCRSDQVPPFPSPPPGFRPDLDKFAPFPPQPLWLQGWLGFPPFPPLHARLLPSPRIQEEWLRHGRYTKYVIGTSQ